MGYGGREGGRKRGLAWATHASVQKSQQIKRLNTKKTTVKPPQLNGHEHKQLPPLSLFPFPPHVPHPTY